ncbi:hypothetical protein VTJ04DRAFT_6166 [Mycothermus thermophilus]|uniref:uncharacterized protein n=1 Tax=Humicola insolens TaxID=85995 RepID=UPI003743C8D6
MPIMTPFHDAKRLRQAPTTRPVAWESAISLPISAGDGSVLARVPGSAACGLRVQREAGYRKKQAPPHSSHPPILTPFHQPTNLRHPQHHHPSPFIPASRATAADIEATISEPDHCISKTLDVSLIARRQQRGPFADWGLGDCPPSWAFSRDFIPARPSPRFYFFDPDRRVNDCVGCFASVFFLCDPTRCHSTPDRPDRPSFGVFFPVQHGS